MTSPLFIPRLLMAALGGMVLAIVGALAHQQTFLAGDQTDWRTLGLPYGTALAVTVLVLWIRRVRYAWGAAAAGIIAVSWVSTTVLLASSSTDILIAPNLIGSVHMIAGGICALVAVGWPSRG